MKKNALYITRAGIIAALYVVLTFISNLLGLASGPVQFRLSEMLCILPCFFPSAIWGLFVGCFLSNLLTGAIVWDLIFGSLATLIGAVGTYFLRKKKVLSFVPPILSNSIIVPWVLSEFYHLEKAYLVIVFTVFLGEFVTVVFGGMLTKTLVKKIPQ